MMLRAGGFAVEDLWSGIGRLEKALHFLGMRLGIGNASRDQDRDGAGGSELRDCQSSL